MQVSDSPQPAPSGPALKDEPPAVRDDAAAGRPRTGPRFQRALERKRHRPAANGGPGDAASGAAMAGWFRPEPAGPTGKAPAVAAVGAPRAVDRVLIGSGPDGAQARIRISAGALAGTEIHLSSAAGGRVVEARLLTHTASSRQTLSVVMDEIRSRLRDRGIALSTGAVAARRSAGAGEQEPAAIDPAQGGQRWTDGPARSRR
jgi:hypothetical protein